MFMSVWKNIELVYGEYFLHMLEHRGTQLEISFYFEEGK